MPQGLLPLFSDDTTPINALVSYQRKAGTIYYFYGSWPVFSHAEDDKASFRMFTSQLYVGGNCKQAEIVRSFGVSAISVKRWVKKYREEGPRAFYETSSPKRKPRVLTGEVLERGQALFDEGRSRREVAAVLAIKEDTLYRAMRSGRLEAGKKRCDRPGADAK